MAYQRPLQVSVSAKFIFELKRTGFEIDRFLTSLLAEAQSANFLFVTWYCIAYDAGL